MPPQRQRSIAGMGEWVVAACREKRLALALSFPFVRRPLSLEAVSATSLQNAGSASYFSSGADMPLMTLNQAKMLLQIAAAYGEPMSVARVKELAAIVGGALRVSQRRPPDCRARCPAIGWAVKAGVGYAGTKAMGLAAVEYFERGGNIAGLAGVVSTATAKATQIAGDVAPLLRGLACSRP